MITCPNCGAHVDEVEDRCPSCSVPLKVTCSNCGASVSAEEEACPSCGTLLTHATEST